jgi:hypothetical protein
VSHDFLITYPLVQMEGETADALNFSGVSQWTPIYNLPGRTGFTSHHIKLADSPTNAAIKKASFRVVFQSNSTTLPAIRLYSLHYSAGVSTGVYDHQWGTVTRRSGFNPDNQALDITTRLRDWLEGGEREAPQLGLEVQGTGVIHEAVLEVIYSIPDYRAELDSLASRIAALEAGSLPAPSQPDDGLMEIVVPTEGVTLKFVQG